MFQFLVEWDDILKINSHVSESKMDTVTGLAGTVVATSLYWPLVYKLRKFGEGIVQAQEYFKYCTKKTKKIYWKTSISTGMYV